MEKSQKEQEERLCDREEKERLGKELYALCDVSKESTDRLRSDDDKKADISFLRDQRKGRNMHMTSSDFWYFKKSKKMKCHEPCAHGPEVHMCSSGSCESRTTCNMFTQSAQLHMLHIIPDALFFFVIS